PADSPTIVKTEKKETVRKPSIKYVELYRKPSKKSTIRGNQRNWNNLKSQQLGVKKGRTCSTNTHKSNSPRPVRVQRLERELKARTPIQKVDRGRSRKPSKKSTIRGNQRNWNNLKSQQLEEFALLVNIILSQRCINASQRHINNSQQSCDNYARMVPAAAKVKE
nr:hypothetical protein [Tanacetum cinerariifolium]